MKTYIKYIILCLLAANIASCGDMDEINTNTDTSTKVPADFLSMQLTLQMTKFEGGKGLFSEAWILKTMSFTEHTEDYLYNDFRYSGFDAYHNLIDATKMNEIAQANEVMADGMKKSYEGLYHFVRAFFFYNATMALGDVPCSDAGNALQGTLRPTYDTQEKVMGSIIRELEQASALFAAGDNFTGDVSYDGNAEKWEKLSNSFMLRVLIQLSKKENVDGINVKQKFAEYAQKPLIETYSGNFQRVYSDRKDQRYPYNELQQNYRTDAVFGKFLIDKLKGLQDYRLFYYAEPAPALLSATVTEDMFEAYSGVDVTAPFSTVQSENARGLHSRNNDRYIYDTDCEPTATVSSSEIQFILAEAAVRGWTTPLSAKEHYDKGVSEAMRFTANFTKDQYRNQKTIDNAYITSYLAGTGKFNESGSMEQKIEQIIWQKFIASFVQLRLNPYYDYRRTGYPHIPINPATNLNRDPNKMPMRWMYSAEESSRNSTNVTEAINRQFGGQDYPTGIMWILK